MWGFEEHKKVAEANKSNRSKFRFNHRRGSKAFSAHRSEASSSSTGEVQSLPDHFKDFHYNEKKGWINNDAQSCYERMVNIQDETQEEGTQPLADEELSQLVFGNKTYYNVGLGIRKSKLPRAHGADTSDHNRVIELESELRSTREELAETKGQFASFMEEHKSVIEQQQLMAEQQRLADERYHALASQMMHIQSFMQNNTLGPSFNSSSSQPPP